MAKAMEAVKTADFPPMERCFVYIIYGCGMRRGEVLALNKDFHIDLKKGVIKVNSFVMYRGNLPEIKKDCQANGGYGSGCPTDLQPHHGGKGERGECGQ
jgi:integrase